MKELITRVWCDHCDKEHDGLRTEAVAHHVVLVDGKPKEIDLCEVGQKEVLGTLLDLLETHGAPFTGDLQRVARGQIVRTPGPQAGRPMHAPSNPEGVTPGGKPLHVECPLCHVTLKRHSMLTHADSSHGVTRPDQPRKCPDCGYVTSDASTPQPMGTHRSRSHGYDPVAMVVEELRSMAALPKQTAKD